MTTDFVLSESPFKNLYKFCMEDMGTYFDPHLRSLLYTSHDVSNKILPPGAFLFSEDRGWYVVGYEYRTQVDFSSGLCSMVSELPIKRAIVYGLVGSVLAPGAAAYALLDAQDSAGYRKVSAIDLLSPVSSGVLEVTPSWNIIHPGKEDTPCVLGVDRAFRPLFN